VRHFIVRGHYHSAFVPHSPIGLTKSWYAITLWIKYHKAKQEFVSFLYPVLASGWLFVIQNLIFQSDCRAFISFSQSLQNTSNPLFPCASACLKSRLTHAENHLLVTISPALVILLHFDLAIDKIPSLSTPTKSGTWNLCKLPVQLHSFCHQKAISNLCFFSIFSNDCSRVLFDHENIWLEWYKVQIA